MTLSAHGRWLRVLARLDRLRIASSGSAAYECGTRGRNPVGGSARANGLATREILIKVRLTSRDGGYVELWPEGYQLDVPDSELLDDDADFDHWLVIGGRVRTADGGRWNFVSALSDNP